MPGKIIPSSGTEGKQQKEKNESVAAGSKKLVKKTKVISLDYYKGQKRKEQLEDNK